MAESKSAALPLGYAPSVPAQLVAYLAKRLKDFGDRWDFGATGTSPHDGAQCRREDEPGDAEN